MSATTDQKVSIRCSTCRHVSIVTRRTLRRWQARGQRPVCPFCVRLARLNASEDDLWFWLNEFGVRRNGRTARQHIARFGLPVGLARLLAMIDPSEPIL